jgi:ABC-type dipeptide/oligopeptide/nickel transport system ATPase component
MNPSLTLGHQLLEIASGTSKKAHILDVLEGVGFANPENVFRSHLHELSGGMHQQAMIALVLVNRPKLLPVLRCY